MYMGFTHTVYLYVYLWSIDKLNIQVRKKTAYFEKQQKRNKKETENEEM